VYFVRKGTPWFDLTRVILPAVGTVGLVYLLMANFSAQSGVDRWAAIGCIVLGGVVALVSPALAARFAKTKTA
jgi:hypothetical protein